MYKNYISNCIAVNLWFLCLQRHHCLYKDEVLGQTEGSSNCYSELNQINKTEVSTYRTRLYECNCPKDMNIIIGYYIFVYLRLFKYYKKDINSNEEEGILWNNCRSHVLPLTTSSRFNKYFYTLSLSMFISIGSATDYCGVKGLTWGHQWWNK